MLTLHAPAKVNLVLEVLGKREDGYHEIKSVMQTISLFDVLNFEEADGIELDCSVSSLQTADNLVLKAVNILRQASGYRRGARIKLKKRIPWGSGLGGGSSDAAITLIGLNKLWSLGLSYEQLAVIGAEVGSDVPFFIYGGRCLVRGRGDWVAPLPDIQTACFVLLKPELPEQADKTKRLYNILKPSHYTAGDFAEQAVSAIDRESRLYGGTIFNVFDSVAFQAFPGLEKYWNSFLHAGVKNIHLAGSGPVLFTLVDNEVEATAIQKKLSDCCINCCIVSSIKRE